MFTSVLPMISLLFMLWGGFLVGCIANNQLSSHDEELMVHYEAIRNDGILWEGDDIGLQPQIVGKHERWMLETQSNPKAFLLKALSTPNRWIAAHIILTLREKKPFMRTPSEWNGLRVEISADGTVTIDERQRETIQKFWECTLEK